MLKFAGADSELARGPAAAAARPGGATVPSRLLSRAGSGRPEATAGPCRPAYARAASAIVMTNGAGAGGQPGGAAWSGLAPAAGPTGPGARPRGPGSTQGPGTGPSVAAAPRSGPSTKIS